MRLARQCEHRESLRRGRTQRLPRRAAWAAADVFVSLADSIQETFGIAPVEAMAAGLPAVVADWDGYRDTVRQGIDGFRIPTLMPSAGLGADLALRHALEADDYEAYIGNVAALTAVDIDAAAAAFARLFASASLRARMGEAARRRAREIFDWKNIFGRYEELWDAQTKMRLTHAPRAIPRIGWTVPPSLLWRVGATRKRRRTTSNCSGSWRWWGSRRPCCQARQKSARCPTRPQAARDLQANWLPG
jgi:hypothetical protein